MNVVDVEVFEDVELLLYVVVSGVECGEVVVVG